MRALATPLLLTLALASSGVAQEPSTAAALGRLVRHLDGAPWETLRTEGEALFLHGDTRVREGVGALRVAPSETDDYYGLTLYALDGRAPTTLACAVFQEGEQDLEYRVKVDDPASNQARDGGALAIITCHPGWTELRIDLAGLRDRRDGRELELSGGVPRFQFSRRRDQAARPFVIDDVRFLGELPGGPDEALRRALASEDGAARARALREGLSLLSVAERWPVAIGMLLGDDHERVRRAARELLVTSGSADLAAEILKLLRRTRSDRRPELLWILAGLPVPAAREEALARVRSPGTPGAEQVALLKGLALRHAADVAALVPELPATAPWPVRSALVGALREAASPTAVDCLIGVLAKPGSPRVAGDAEEALVALTGQDLGDDAGAWAAWWKANRERARLGLGNAPRRDGYGRFFGIPVPRGRTVFVLDVSGSMRDPVQGGRAAEHIARSPWLAASEIATRLDLARGELAHALEAMPETAEAGVVVYNDEALWITKGIERATEALKARAVKRLGGVAAGDRTNVYAGLAAALHPGQKPSPKDLTEGPDTVFLLSDGNPSTGLIISRPELRDAVLRWNLARDVRIHAVNVGNADASMLRGIAHGTGGTYVDLRSDRESPKEE